MTEQAKTADSLWQNYAFLTQEILKFVQKKEFDMVLELLDQRDKLQLIIEQTKDNDCEALQEKQELLQKLQTQNQIITTTLQRYYNKTKHTRQVSNSYDQLGIVAAGSYINRQS